MKKDNTSLTNIINSFVNNKEEKKIIYKFILDCDEENSKKILYQLITDYKNYDFDIVNEKIKNKSYGWNEKVYQNIKNIIEEQDNFLLNPFEVEEGVLECRCGSKKVFSYSKQVRSCDEGTSVFASCTECKSTWIHSG